MADQSAQTPVPQRFPPDELAKWRERLLDLAREIDANVGALQAEAISSERIAPASNHLAEGASDMQAQHIGTSEAEQVSEMQRLVVRALEKIDTGRPLPFGICEQTRQPIDEERLDLIPWAPFSQQVSERIEREGLAIDDLLLPS